MHDRAVLVAERETADYFESVAKGRDPKQAANWITGPLFGALNKTGQDISESPIDAERLGHMLDLIADGTLSRRTAKDVFAIMLTTDDDPAVIVTERGLRQITDMTEIEVLVDRIVAENPREAAAVAAGNQKIIGWFVGQVMKASGGKANPSAVNHLLRTRLSTSDT